MSAVALELERETARDESTPKGGREAPLRVGGESQIAVLSEGRVSIPPVDRPVQVGIGDALKDIQFRGADITCVRDPAGNPAGMAFVMPSGQIQGHITSCFQDIDDFVVLKSIFTDSILYYSGRGKLIFSDDTQIQRSTLRLGSSVDLQSPAINHLMCNFPWTTILQ